MSVEQFGPSITPESLMFEVLGQQQALDALLRKDTLGSPLIRDNCRVSISTFDQDQKDAFIQKLLTGLIDPDWIQDKRDGALILFGMVDLLGVKTLDDNFLGTIQGLKDNRIEAFGNIGSFVQAVKIATPYLDYDVFKEIMDQMKIFPFLFSDPEEKEYLQNEIKGIIHPVAIARLEDEFLSGQIQRLEEGLGETNMAIVRMRDENKSYSMMAEELGISYANVQRRVKRLINKGIIPKISSGRKKQVE